MAVKLYVGSTVSTRAADVQIIVHAYPADSEWEAVGRATTVAVEAYPSADGWRMASVKMTVVDDDMIRQVAADIGAGDVPALADATGGA